MSQVQLPANTQPEQQKEEESPPRDDSWVGPPPGGPDSTSTKDIDIPALPSHQRQHTRDFSLEDLEVARALTGLRQASPFEKTVPGSEYSTYQTPSSSSQSEPLLSLLTSQHPFIGHAINHSLSAYNVGKQYSGPLRSSVDFVERNIASPVASTVGTAGRISGVENGVRWWLERRRSSSNGVPQMLQTPTNGHKRRREDSDSDLEQGLPAQRSRAPSDISMTQGEYLPAYDSNRSPSYSSRDPYPPPKEPSGQQKGKGVDGPVSSSGWQTRLILSTSGLGVAMSHESRRSLKYCLSWLRWANGRLGRTLYSLQTVLSEYEVAQRQAAERSNGSHPDYYSPAHQPRDLQTISAQLTALKAECVKTLQSAMEVVSKYAGGALPENARMVVRNHLTSLPQRFAFMASLQEKEEEVLRRNAEARQNGSAEPGPSRTPTTPDLESGTHDSAGDSGRTPHEGESTRTEQENVVLGARRVVVLAREGLDMMAQVSAVVDGTITSAEQWCERLGRKLSEEEQQTLREHEPSTTPQPRQQSEDDAQSSQSNSVQESHSNSEQIRA